MNSVAIRRDICFIIDLSFELMARIIRVTETVFMLQIVGNAELYITGHYSKNVKHSYLVGSWTCSTVRHVYFKTNLKYTVQYNGHISYRV